MSKEESGEKQFDPTPKRLREAAKKGDVLRSKELATAATVLMGTAWLIFAGPWLFAELLDVARQAFMFDRSTLEGDVTSKGLSGLLSVILPVMILGLLVGAASVISQLAFGEGRWVAENLNFKGSRINPLSGLQRMFGPTGLIEIGKGLLKVTLLGSIAAGWGWMHVDAIADLGRMGLSDQLRVAWTSLITLFASLAGGLVVIALVDLPIQWIRRKSRLKMSHKEMRDESKEAEGSAEMRQARRQRQRDIATGNVAGAMREAQFVLTNPTHFSVAMAWDPGKAAAPIVLAKGRGDKALAIRDLAREHELPLLEYPQLTRALYFSTREKQVIREELYAAVAMIVAFVMSVRRGEKPTAPAVDVPVALRFDAEGQLSA